MKIGTKRWPLLTSFVLFIALCISAAYWAMQLFRPPVRAVAAPPQAARVPPAPKLEAAATLFGGRSSVTVASNFQLKGVVVAGNPAESVAILATNGKPAQSIRINAEVVPGVVLKEVQRSHVLLSEGGAIKRVELPEKAKAQMGAGISTSPAGIGSPPAGYPAPPPPGASPGHPANRPLPPLPR
jgi:general secretion pathway protein C